MYTPATTAGSSGTLPSFPVGLPTGTITVTVLPTAASHSYTTPAGQTLVVGANGVLAGATGSGLSAVLVTGPPTGPLTLSRDGSFRFTPSKGVSGSFASPTAP